jgi:hypothetical protein
MCVQKSLKTLAARNTATLNRTHIITLVVHLVYHLSRFFFSAARRKLLPYILLSLPALIFEVYFERLSRPSYDSNGDLRRAGEDLEAKGLTEWMWDVLYWTTGCVLMAALFGDYGWWLWTIVPAYSIWLAFTTYSGMKGGMGGLMGAGNENGSVGGGAGQSKRQAKMEKRGGQKMVYR